jgi:hypothetical protein
VPRRFRRTADPSFRRGCPADPSFRRGCPAFRGVNLFHEDQERLEQNIVRDSNRTGCQSCSRLASRPCLVLVTFQTAVMGDPFTAGVVQVLLPVPVPSGIPAKLPSSSGTCFRLAAYARDPAKIDRVTKRLGLGLDPRIVLLRHQPVTLAVPASSLPTRSVLSASSPWSRQTFPNSEVMTKHLHREW